MPIESCPLCYRMYVWLGQHLTVMRSVKNKVEKKYLLALESGRVKVRQGAARRRPVWSHTELSATARDDTIISCKQRKILEILGALRASNPEVPMVSTLDLEAALPDMEDPSTAALHPKEEREEECSSRACKRVVKRLRAENADLNQQVDQLTETLRAVTHRYHVLRHKYEAKGSERIKQVARRLLSSLRPEEEENEEEEQPTAQRKVSLHPLPSPPSSPQECAPSTSQPGPSTGKPSQLHYPG